MLADPGLILGHSRALSDAKALADRALALLPGGLVVYLGFRSGGFFPNTESFVAIVLVLVLLARVTLAERPLAGLGAPSVMTVAALALFAGWTILSGQWSHAPGRALIEFDRVLLYLLVFLLFGSVARGSARTALMIRGVAAGAAVVCICSLITRVLPNAWSVAPNIANQRLSYPVSYWNALGVLAAIGITLSLHLTSHPREHPVARVLGAVAVPVMATTLFFTFSRGGILTGVVGVVLYAVLGRPRALLPALVATVPATAVAVTTAYDANLLATANPTTPAAVSQGHHVAIVVLIAAIFGGALRFVLLPVDGALERWHLPDEVRRSAVGTSLAVGAVAALIAVFALHVPHAIAHQYDRFVHGTNVGHADLRQRLTDPGNNGRVDLWRVAWHGLQASSFHGQGAGTYAVLWAQKRPYAAHDLNAHSLYMEVLDELGVVGLILLATSLLVMLAGTVSRARGPDRPLYAAIFAVGAAWAWHAGIDWDWQMPVITLPALALGATALARSHHPQRKEDQPASALDSPLGGPASVLRLGLGMVVGALAVIPILVNLSDVRLRTSLDAYRTGNCAHAIAAAQDSLSAIGSRPEPWEVIGYCRADEQLYPGSAQAMESAISRDPRSWEPWYGLALVQAAFGRDPRPALAAAVERNPREQLLIAAEQQFAHLTRSQRPRAVAGFRTVIGDGGYPAIGA